MYPFPKTKIRKLVCIGIYKKAVLYRIKPRYFLTSLSVEKSTKKSARIGGDYKGNLFRITDNLMKKKLFITTCESLFFNIAPN